MAFDTRKIEYFLAVIDHRNISRAAEALRVLAADAQPADSCARAAVQGATVHPSGSWRAADGGGQAAASGTARA